MNTLYGSPEWLVEFRVVVLFGWVILASWWAVDVYLIYRLWKPRQATETCKLHSRPVGTCDPGSHDDD